ncbi:MAG: hypothetical protein QUS11_11260 [Candidatus Fermentibacter sp.]|nr:hypothetical protein [Candidatus Fermentibacter sp.]
MSSKKSEKRAEQDQAIAELRKILRPGDRVYGIVRSVSRSGMSRTISFYAIKKNQPVYLTGYMARALGLTMTRGYHDAVRVHGCGMDMCFATVYDLGRRLWPDGGKIEKSSRRGLNPGQDARERDGGYLLRSDSL